MRKLILTIIVIFCFAQSFGNVKNLEMQIRLFASTNVQVMYLVPKEATAIYDGKKKLGIAYKSDNISIVSTGKYVNVKFGNKEFSEIVNLKFESQNKDVNYILRGLNNTDIEREYEGNLEISADSNGLKIINFVNLEAYIAGVIEAEVGTKLNNEFYKTKAIICRTYALKEFKKHKNENHYLCDSEHCQVYKGVCKNQNIKDAVKQTATLVIADKDNYLISAVFHSNCGGVTCNSEDVWTNSTSYLKSVVDTFCLNQSRAKWEKKLALSDWINYLSQKYGYPALDIQALRTAMNWEQYERQIYFANDTAIALKNVRNDWKLPSTFFSIQQQSDSVLFVGKGSGHGIGLCQQGAMRMSELQYTYEQIINFYYKDVKIVGYNLVKDKLLK